MTFPRGIASVGQCTRPSCAPASVYVSVGLFSERRRLGDDDAPAFAIAPVMRARGLGGHFAEAILCSTGPAGPALISPIPTNLRRSLHTLRPRGQRCRLYTEARRMQCRPACADRGTKRHGVGRRPLRCARLSYPDVQTPSVPARTAADRWAARPRPARQAAAQEPEDSIFPKAARA